MKKLLMLFLVLIPATVFAAKGVSSFARSEVCPELQNLAFSLTLLFVSNDRDVTKAAEDNDLKLANVYSNLRDISDKGAADISTIYQTFCNEK